MIILRATRAILQVILSGLRIIIIALFAPIGVRKTKPRKPCRARVMGKEVIIVPKESLKEGPNTSSHFSVWQTDDETLRVRINMPGIDPSNLVLTVGEHRNWLRFDASENPDDMHGLIRHPGFAPLRTYYGTLHFDDYEFHANDCPPELANGILWLQFKRRSNLKHLKFANNDLFTSKEQPVFLEGDIIIELPENASKCDCSYKSCKCNLFISNGNKFGNISQVGNGDFIYAVDTPGIADGIQGVTMTVEDNKIKFHGGDRIQGVTVIVEGDEIMCHTQEIQQHRYEANMNVPRRAYKIMKKVSSLCNLEEASTEIKNGVLWVIAHSHEKE